MRICFKICIFRFSTVLARAIFVLESVETQHFTINFKVWSYQKFAVLLQPKSKILCRDNWLAGRPAQHSQSR